MNGQTRETPIPPQPLQGPPAICKACGTQFPSSAQPPTQCPICSDARQFVPPTGQSWTDLNALRSTHANAYKRLRPDLYQVVTRPAFGIGQRALLARTAQGNVLWDCIALLDDATVDIVNALGGLHAIAISHPHYYTTMVEWAHAFDCPVWLHQDDRDWVMRPDDAVKYWSGETFSLNAEATLVRLGGHFTGGAVLHWRHEGGILLSGDVLQVTPDRSHVSFMYSYPNYLPLSAGRVRSMERALDGYAYDAVYGSFENAQIERNAKQAVTDSVQRYIALLENE